MIEMKKLDTHFTLETLFSSLLHLLCVTELVLRLLSLDCASDFLWGFFLGRGGSTCEKSKERNPPYLPLML